MVEQQPVFGQGDVDILQARLQRALLDTGEGQP